MVKKTTPNAQSLKTARLYKETGNSYKSAALST